jgi:hypothetical protein
MTEGFLELLGSDHVLLQQQFSELDRHEIEKTLIPSAI